MSKRSGYGFSYIGCSGFSYEHWGDGVFYPQGIPQRKWLEFYSEKFNTVELNVTFYRLPPKETFISWKNRTTKNFCFVVKGSKLITHLKQLKGVKGALEEFIGRAKFLEEKLGPILWQLPPGFKVDIDRLESFIELLEGYSGLRNAFEFRNQTWIIPEVEKLLKEANSTICRTDYPRNLPEPEEDFPFIYIRRHGPEKRAYSGCYSKDELSTLAKSIKAFIKSGKDVYVYFNNDIGGYAPQNALELKELVVN